MRYAPLNQADAVEAAAALPSSSSSTSALDALLIRLGFASSTSEPAEWKSSVDEAPIYRMSCFAYCAAGGLLLLHPEPLERHMRIYPWRLVGLMVFANGWFSYMADVEMWGRASRWKAADRLLATTNSLLQIAVVVLAALGHATFPLVPVVVLASGVSIALVCKQRASAAMRRGDCERYLRWHAAWHYTLPLGAIVGQLLLHSRCDYSWEASCACDHHHRHHSPVS